MTDIYHFVIYYAQPNYTEAKALRDVLKHLDLNGELYDELSFKNAEEVLENTAAQLFLCSDCDWGNSVQSAKEFCIKTATAHSLIIPVYLSPGKDELLHTGSKTNRGVATANANSIQAQTKQKQVLPAERLYGFSTLPPINVYKPRGNHGQVSDESVIKSPEFRKYIEQNVKQTIVDRQKEEMRKRNKKEFGVGLDEQGLLRRNLAAEKATGVDVLGHENFAKKIVDVMIESPTFDTPATIGIFAPWGSGKSRFIKFIKKNCRQKPDHFYLSSSEVNCCLRDNSINWCHKLFLYLFISIVITVITLATITALTLRDSEQITQDVICRNHSNTETDTNITTTMEPCLPEIYETLIYFDGWTYAGISLAITLVLLIIFIALCQRKIWHDCKATCLDCCCCYEEITKEEKEMIKEDNPDDDDNIEIKSNLCKCFDTSNRDRNHSNEIEERVPLEVMQNNKIDGGGRAEVNSTSKKNTKKSIKKKECAKHCCLDTRTLCYMSFFQPPRFTQETIADHDISVIKVDFNAWEYSGCDYLWAGIVTTLGSVVEDYFGKWTVRICRIMLKRSIFSSDDDDTEPPTDPRSYSWICCKLRHKLYVMTLLLGFIVIVATVMVALIGSQYAEPFKESRMYIYLTTSIAALGILLTAFGTVINALTKSTKSVVKEISKEMIGEDFQQELGFMHKIKEEVHHITELINFMSRLYGCRFRVLLIIDDLDRCQPSRIMGILEAVNLLLEPKNDDTRSPYVSLLAIDPRVVLGAIERHFDPDQRQDFSQANVNGYEYLKKIIHMPFCLPVPTLEEKQEFIEQLMKRDDYVESEEATQPIPTTSRVRPERMEGNVQHADIDGEASDEEMPTSPTSPILPFAGSPTISEEPTDAEELMIYIQHELKDRMLLALINGNPRTLKRICNVILLALSVFRGKRLKRPEAFKLTLVVIMVEQWPFRTSFLRQYYLNQIQKRHQPNPKNRLVGDDLVIKGYYFGTQEKVDDDLGEMELVTMWKNQQSLVMEIEGWKKFLGLDYDPELFHAFLDTYRLRVKHLSEYLPYAVNHDTNIESIVEQGLAEIDLKGLRKETNDSEMQTD